MSSKYFLWLVSLAGNIQVELLNYLNEYVYYSKLPNDDNRESDGLGLRERFESFTDSKAGSEECSMLEMLIGVAYRMEDMLYHPNGSPSGANLFWELVQNLGLEIGNDFRNNDILYKFLERLHEPNGKGGLFPLENPEKDQRYVEVWYQMMYYIKERYSNK